MISNNMIFAKLATLLLSVLALGASYDIRGSSTRDLVNIRDLDMSLFLDEEEERHRHLGEAGQFGERCGTLFGECAQGLDCGDVSTGKRCLPNSCLKQHSTSLINDFDVGTYKKNLYAYAGYSEGEILAKLAEVKDERKFLETQEFQSLQAALHANLDLLDRVVELSRTCIGTVNDTVTGKETGTVSYIGMHIEAGAIIDATLQYLVTSNGADQRSVLRLCLGAELGAGAEISYIFGFTNTATTKNMLCGSVVADVDIVLIVAAGAAVGYGFNGVFFYEFTFGGGLGLGLGGAICTGLQYGNATVVNGTRFAF